MSDSLGPKKSLLKFKSPFPNNGNNSKPVIAKPLMQKLKNDDKPKQE